MTTVWAPIGEPCTKANCDRHIKAMRDINHPTEDCWIAEPSGPDCLSDYHLHMWNWWGRRHAVTKVQIAKLVKHFGHKMSAAIDFTKRAGKGFDAIQGMVNDAKYAHGDSEKDKAAPLFKGETPGYANVVTDLQTQLTEQKAGKKATGGNSEEPDHKFVMNLMMYNQGIDEQCRNACANLQLNRTPINFNWFIFLLQEKARLRKIERAYTDTIVDMKVQALPVKEPNTFQQSCDAQTDALECGRGINAYVNPDGNAGKTVQAKRRRKLYPNDACLVKNGKTADIAFSFDISKSEVHFNLPRYTDMQKVNYAAVEDLLDGEMWCPKYESCLKTFMPCKVIMYTNKYPATDRLSPDRWHIFYVANKDTPAVPWEPKHFLLLNDEDPFKLEESAIHRAAKRKREWVHPKKLKEMSELDMFGERKRIRNQYSDSY